MEGSETKACNKYYPVFGNCRLNFRLEFALRRLKKTISLNNIHIMLLCYYATKTVLLANFLKSVFLRFFPFFCYPVAGCSFEEFLVQIILEALFLKIYIYYILVFSESIFFMPQVSNFTVISNQIYTCNWFIYRSHLVEKQPASWAFSKSCGGQTKIVEY